MRKVIETILGPSGDVIFLHRGKVVSDLKVVELLRKECHPYSTQGNSGVIIYMPREKYESFRKKS